MLSLARDPKLAAEAHLFCPASDRVVLTLHATVCRSTYAGKIVGQQDCGTAGVREYRPAHGDSHAPKENAITFRERRESLAGYMQEDTVSRRD